MSTPESSYNRPTFPRICGRAGMWEKPCPFGPNADGSCGGTQECQPSRQGDRWVCRRPKAQGGPCTDGPLPDGMCAQSQPPCRPRASLRVQRLRLAIAAMFLTIGVLFAFGSGGEIFGNESLVLRDPGPLRVGHLQTFTENGCAGCHVPHDRDVLGFLQAGFDSSAPDTPGSNACLDCHIAASDAGDPHKGDTCVSCHRTHAGLDAPVTSMADSQCHACHKTKFDTFSKGHPPFQKSYPHDRRTAINFDHAKHSSTHFKNSRFDPNAPGDRCVLCHDTTRAGRDVPVKSFQETCAGCHADQIKGQDLVVFNLPELEENPIDAEAIADVCRLPVEDAGEEFESVSVDPLDAVTAWLLDLDPDDAAGHASVIGEFLTSTIEDGPSSLSDAVTNLGGKPHMLLAGLSPEILRQAACAWALNLEYEGPEPPNHGGWFADSLSLRYRANGHPDSVVKAWIDLAAVQQVDAVNATLLDPDGPGTCVNCHGVSEADAVQVDWVPQSRPAHAQFRICPPASFGCFGAGFAVRDVPCAQCRSQHCQELRVDGSFGIRARIQTHDRRELHAMSR